MSQVVKRDVRCRVVSAERRVVRWSRKTIAVVLSATERGTGLKTAALEHLNATFRASLTLLVRRGRAIAHTDAIADRWDVAGRMCL